MSWMIALFAPLLLTAATPKKGMSADEIDSKFEALDCVDAISSADTPCLIQDEKNLWVVVYGPNQRVKRVNRLGDSWKCLDKAIKKHGALPSETGQGTTNNQLVVPLLFEKSFSENNCPQFPGGWKVCSLFAEFDRRVHYRLVPLGGSERQCANAMSLLMAKRDSWQSGFNRVSRAAMHGGYRYTQSIFYGRSGCFLEEMSQLYVAWKSRIERNREQQINTAFSP